MRPSRAWACGLAVAAALAGLTGCGADGGKEPALPAASTTEDTTTPVPRRALLTFVMEGATGNAALTVDLAPDGSGTVRGDLGGAVNLTASALRGGKRRWLSDGRLLGDVRLEGSGKIKLKDPSGTAQWVVKDPGSDKVKLLQGEETEVYSLQPRPGGTTRVKQGDEEVGAVKIRSSGGAKVEGPDGTSVLQTALVPSPGMGVLLMARIPAVQRAVLTVELVDRARG